ncbi:hypothetical protein Dtox_0798 [Desulfofarcimen acetoxidans DSM 771]|uniref:Transcriptional modulator of MazE/toxin, MazF n=1 Tax=Desulfofarcimen acetoxidans (strain ATCC 49208 / DSM 771 / KCTC 5769 / VKM B-1644 / 5575) TaxID=485916 RepID=C8W243_DESAS|nr:type II toxin-antitoxin system PemK/MazF family toxin [Desulfofarcimen acetoxidans]ACV61707.1 hypothetical protein Dtox_0798 [Desulfofarcimen acetoxidans DSM 771]
MTTSMGTKFNQGDIWIARVRFIQDLSKVKARPVVIVGKNIAHETDVIINPITTESPRTDFDIPIINWQKAGLAGPSIIRASKPLTIIGSELHKKIGELDPDDLVKVLQKNRELY